jgi:hypothetical protein
MDEEDYKYSALDNLQYSKTLEAAHLIALSIVVKALIATSSDKKGLFKNYMKNWYLKFKLVKR